MEVISLQGASNKGKSETINIIYQMLLLNGYTQVPGVFVGPLGNSVMKDFLDVLQKGNKLVGIVSQGDYVIGANSLKNHLAKLFAAGCHKTICACTTKAGTISAVNAYKNIVIHKTIAITASLERLQNNFDATTIYNQV